MFRLETQLDTFAGTKPALAHASRFAIVVIVVQLVTLRGFWVGLLKTEDPVKLGVDVIEVFRTVEGFVKLLPVVALDMVGNVIEVDILIEGVVKLIPVGDMVKLSEVEGKHVQI